MMDYNKNNKGIIIFYFVNSKYNFDKDTCQNGKDKGSVTLFV